MPVMTGGSAIARTLIANGVDTVFGLPGVQCDHIFDGLYHERDKLRAVYRSPVALCCGAGPRLT